MDWFLGNGMIRFDSKNHGQSFTMNDRVTNNTVYAIVPDTKGYFWCSNNNKAFSFSKKITAYFPLQPKDGLQTAEFNGTQFIHFPDGRSLWRLRKVSISHP